MYKLAFIVFVLLHFSSNGSSQTFPTESQYLGQTPPGTIPQKFSLSVNPGSFAAERIAISNDGKEIYYTEVKNYYPASGDTIKYYSFSSHKWTGPFNLLPGYLSPALSVTGDTLYFQTAGSEYETFMLAKTGNGWGRPGRILKNLNSAHYLQVTDKGNYYVSSKSTNTAGGNDWCILLFENSDSIAQSFGRPLNTELDNLDFFIAKDESFMITATITGLAISYHRPDGGWTSPRSLGKNINFGISGWGPYVTPDNKYLFYTTGTKPDYSDTGIFWVRIDKLIDSLKKTNNTPYLQKRLEDKVGYVNRKLDFTIPEYAFRDDDGETKFSYSAMLNTGKPFPEWLDFNKISGNFSGTPAEPGEFTLIIFAADKENAKGFGVFNLSIKGNQ